MELKSSSCSPNHRVRFGILLCLSLVLTQLHGAETTTEGPLSSNHVIKNNPIVIHTKVDNYDQPTLEEYEQCQQNLDACQNVCKTAPNPEGCKQQCPTCPYLVKKDVAVQGVNDTNIQMPDTKPVNSTNVIRLTNEIRNIIDNKMGNIATRNENNVVVHQNITSKGGQFGLGYNENGSCCIVLRSSRGCELRNNYYDRCQHKRHRVCGERCKSRVMRAKRVTQCPDNEVSNCKESIEYVPYKFATANRGGKCRYINTWPYVKCGARHRQQCKRCFELPYGMIVQRGVPPQCMRCYRMQGGASPGFYNPSFYNPYMMYPSFYSPMYPMYGGGGFPSQYPPQQDNSFGWNDDDQLMFGNGWTLDKTKCRNSQGEISEDCGNHLRPVPEEPIEGSGSDTEPSFNDLYNSFDSQDYNNDFDDDYDYGNMMERRHRRQVFRASSYAKRHRN